MTSTTPSSVPSGEVQGTGTAQAFREFEKFVEFFNSSGPYPGGL